ncbi:MAG: hypothetical protein HAW60_04445 [Bdellovibrionales bacterium]|nr:hypothetical protein [Bdellovibrionales bacterium]
MKALFSIFTINLIAVMLCVVCTSNNAYAENKGILKKLNIAKKHFKKKECKKMIEVLNQSIADLSSMWLKKMAYCFKKTNNLKQGQNIYIQILHKNPNDYFSHFALAKLYQKENLQKKDKAPIAKLVSKHFRLAVKKKKTFVAAYYYLFKILRKEKNYYEIQALSEALLKSVKNNKKALVNLCFSYFKQDYVYESVIWCKQAIKHNKKTPIAENFVYLSISLNKQREKSGDKLILYAEKKFPKSLIIAETLANKYYKYKKYSLSSKYYKKIIELKSKDFNSLKNAIWNFFETKKYDLALKAVKQLCSINKQDAVHVVRTAINKLETSNQKQWLSPYKLSLAKDCY